MKRLVTGRRMFDMSKTGAVAAYTLDVWQWRNREREFSADQLVVRAVGHNIQPSIVKVGWSTRLEDWLS